MPSQQLIHKLKKRLKRPGAQPNARRRLNQIQGRNQPRPGNAQPNNSRSLDPNVAAQAGRSPLPWNSQYQSSVSGLRLDMQNLQAGLNYQRQGIEQEYGFNDPSDPYSRARLLEKSFQEQQRGTLNSAAGAGQLYSGATQRAREANVFNYGQQQNALRGEYNNALFGLNQQRVQGEADYRRGLAEAEGRRLEDALQEPPDPTTAPPIIPTGGRDRNRNRRRRRRRRR